MTLGAELDVQFAFSYNAYCIAHKWQGGMVLLVVFLFFSLNKITSAIMSTNIKKII
jgi:hypothetical protein